MLFLGECFQQTPAEMSFGSRPTTTLVIMVRGGASNSMVPPRGIYIMYVSVPRWTNRRSAFSVEARKAAALLRCIESSAQQVVYCYVDVVPARHTLHTVVRVACILVKGQPVVCARTKRPACSRLVLWVRLYSVTAEVKTTKDRPGSRFLSSSLVWIGGQRWKGRFPYLG